MDFGVYIRRVRERLRAVNPRYSIRQTAERVGLDAGYLSKLERGKVPLPSEEVIRRLAFDLDQDPDALLALAGYLPEDVCAIVMRRPILFAELIRGLGDVSEEELDLLVCQLRDRTL